MGTFESFRKAYGALKDSTKVGLAKVNSEYKDLDIAVVKATNHVECPPKERRGMLERYFPPLLLYSLGLLGMGTHICAFLEERLECFRTLNYDIESERLTKISPGATKAHSRTRLLSREELLEQVPALQQLLYRPIGCQPEGAACYNYLIQYALALFFEMSRHDAVKALNIYKRAGQQADKLGKFYEFCKALDLARNFQFPTLRQPPPSFLSTMEEYMREAPQSGSLSNKKLDYQEKPETLQELEEPQEPESPKTEEPVDKVEEAQDDKRTENTSEEPQVKTETESAPLISADDVGDLLGLSEPNPQALELEQANALALAIVQPGSDPLSTNHGLSDFGASSSGWELALATTPTNSSSNQLAARKFAGGSDKLLLDCLYEDDNARRHLQLQNAGYNYDMAMQYPSYAQPDPFAVSNIIAPPSDVQLAMIQQQQQQMMYQNQYQQQQQQYRTT